MDPIDYQAEVLKINPTAYSTSEDDDDDVELISICSTLASVKVADYGSDPEEAEEAATEAAWKKAYESLTSPSTSSINPSNIEDHHGKGSQ